MNTDTLARVSRDCANSGHTVNVWILEKGAEYELCSECFVRFENEQG